MLVQSRASWAALIDEGIRPDRLRLWRHGVDTTRFSPMRASNAVRRAWHVDQRRPAILYAGRLGRSEGLGLIEPLRRRLWRHGLDHQLVLVGDGPMRAELEARCPEVTFLGNLPEEQLAITMASADVFLSPSPDATGGQAVLEAQASGLSVIVADRGGACEQVVSDSSGIVCGAGDVDSFAQALIGLLRGPRVRADLGRGAREYAESCDPSRTIASLLEVWRTATSHRGEVAGTRFGPAATVRSLARRAIRLQR